MLASAAAAKGYPVQILRLSIAAYRLQRSIGIDGIYSRTIVATRGITAGSGFATSELLLLLMDTMVELSRGWVGVLTFKLFVDDLTLAACGLPQHVVSVMVAAIDFVIDQFETVLCMEVSAKKSKVLAGRPAIALAIATRIRSRKLGVTLRARLLGTDTTGGRRRGTQVAQERLRAFTALVPRFHQLRKLGVNTQQMVRASGPPAILYGCEVMGVSNSKLLTTRSKVAAAAAPQAGGKSPELILYAVDGPGGTLDPAFDAHARPLQFWALAWWESWFSADALQQAFDEAARKLLSARGSWWSLVAGPATALLASLRRLGWSMRSAVEVIDDCGSTWRFDRDSPAAMISACHRSVRRWRLQKIGEILPGLIPAATDLPEAMHTTKTMLIDFSSIFSPLIHR